MKLILDDLLGKGGLQVKLRRQLLPAAAMLSVFLAVYGMSLWVQPGLLTWVLSTGSWAVIFLTAVARVNDLADAAPGLRWQVRKTGLVFCAGGVVAVALQGLHAALDAPTWGEVLMFWGIALTWMTTPAQPPWWRLISGQVEGSHGP